MFVQKDPLVKSQKTIDLWLQLFTDILDDEKLTKKLWNTLKGTLETEGSPKEFIVFYLPKRNIGRVQRRKWISGR